MGGLQRFGWPRMVQAISGQARLYQARPGQARPAWAGQEQWEPRYTLLLRLGLGLSTASSMRYVCTVHAYRSSCLPWCCREQEREIQAAEEKRQGEQKRLFSSQDGLWGAPEEPKPREGFPPLVEGEPVYQKNEGGVGERGRSVTVWWQGNEWVPTAIHTRVALRCPPQALLRNGQGVGIPCHRCMPAWPPSECTCACAHTGSGTHAGIPACL